VNQDVRNLLAGALHDEPALGIDRDRTLAAGRRRVHLHRAAVMAGIMTTVAALAIGSLAVGTTLSRGPSGEPPGGPTSSSSMVTSQLPGCPEVMRDEPRTERSVAEGRRLTEAVRQLQIQLPAGVSMEPFAEFCAEEEDQWTTSAIVHGPNGDRTVQIKLRPLTVQPSDYCPEGMSCRTFPVDDGSTIRVVENGPGDPDPSFAITAWRHDGTHVMLRDLPWGGQIGPAPRNTARILDDDALIALAMAPQLRVEVTAAQPPPANERRAAELHDVVAGDGVLPPGVSPVRNGAYPVGLLEFYADTDGIGYTLYVDLVDAAGEGDLFIAIDSPARSDGETLTCVGRPLCEQVTLPDGRPGVFIHDDPYGQPATTFMLMTKAPDGALIRVESRNLSASAERRGEPTSRSEPTLGLDELAHIATLPGLQW